MVGCKLGLAVVLSLLATGPGWAAECNAEIQRIQSQAANITDPKTKRLVQYDITRAQREATDNDSLECQQAIDHADGLLGRLKP